MQDLIYASHVMVTTDAVAEALVTYAADLAARRTSDLVTVPVIYEGRSSFCQLLVGAGFPRTAKRYIDDNLHQPLTGAEIARACGVSIRALQLAFRAETNTTPTEYLRHQRLRRARDTLLLADPATQTVRQIALEWGFTHPGRFAGDYYKTYGEHPRVTLNR